MVDLAAKSAFNMLYWYQNASLTELFNYGDVTIHTSTSFVVTENYNGTYDRLSLTGTFGGYQSDDTPTTGTITGGSFVSQGTLLFSFSGASMPVLTNDGTGNFTMYVQYNEIEMFFRDLLKGDDRVTGSSGDDTLFAYEGNDRIDGGAGIDHMDGGNGDDTYYVDNSKDVITEYGYGGLDTVYATCSSYVLAGNVENLTYTGTGNFSALGNTGSNIIRGGVGNDALDGGGGFDTLFGGDGDDTYYVRSGLDQTIETASGGTDLVKSETSDWTLGNYIENLQLYGPYAYNGTGNALDNIITGNSNSNILDGSGGADTLIGGYGDDRFVVDNAGDTVVENADGGASDIVESSISYRLTANVEMLTLTGTDAINATGNELANTITGNGGANVINGGAGADMMVGGYGNDTYYVDNAGDQVIETYVDGGVDTVYSAVSSYTLLDNEFGYVENLTYTGTAAFTGTGNSMNNVLRGAVGSDRLVGASGDDKLIGNAGNDTLDGGAGLDRLYGGAGNDTYVVSDSTDYIYENAGEGADLVLASVSLALRANVENLTLTGTTNIAGTGNDLANVITGNDGANKLDGGAGDDRLTGGLGNDTLTGGAGVDRMYGGVGDDSYVVGDTTDYAYENAGEGTDRVLASVSYSLRAEIENLTLTGSAAINGTGNDLANSLTGNGAANKLLGLAGDDKLYGQGGSDWLQGGLGRDQLTGGAGADNFVFAAGDTSNSASTADIIRDFTHSDGDKIRLNAIDANSTLDGDQAFSFIGTAAFSHVAGELHYRQVNGLTIVEGDTDGDGVADVVLRLDGLHELVANDFVF